MTILPGETPCLRCVFEAAPAPGEAGTCETAGVLAPIVSIIASFQATEAIKILTGQLDTINRELLYIDVWENMHAPHQDRAAARQGRLPVLPAPAVRVARRRTWARRRRACAAATPCRCRTASAAKLNFEEMAPHLEADGRQVSYNRFMLKFDAEGYEFTVFPDGRAIIKGTNDIDKARTLYAKYVGH